MFRKKNKTQTEEKAQHEFQARLNVKRTLNAMRMQWAKLDTFKTDYIDKARKAALTGNDRTYQLAKTGLKLCLSKQRFLEEMIANFELSLQITDMNKVIVEFMKGMEIISEQMKEVASVPEMAKAQQAYETAIQNNEGQYEALDVFLSTAVSSLDSFNGAKCNVSDEEIDKLVSMQAVNSEAALDNEIDAKISEIKGKLMSEGD